MKKVMKISSNDNVVVALEKILKDEELNIDNEKITIAEDIDLGHKIAIHEIPINDSVIKYGEMIGVAISNIKSGEWVHTHNCKTNLNEHEEYKYEPNAKSTEINHEKMNNKMFDGYRRVNGKVGVRNEIWIIPTVGCVNDVVQYLEREAQAYLTDTVECIASFRHPYGCSQVGQDQINTQKVLANLAMHPNTAGILLVGLGCENSGIEEVKKYIKDDELYKIKSLVCQNIDDEIEVGLQLIRELIEETKGCKREAISASELIIGLKCGGSDGLSGITANPVVGNFSDLIVHLGGTTILTEVPEMFGAERLLMNRCQDEITFNKTVCLINDFKNYYVENNSPIYENPSPGNKKGGITTLEDKSLGCTQKSGNTQVVDVIKYGDTISKKGLNLLESPGNDLVAATALAASGAHVVLFTTGRGTPFASPVPTVKISSNTQLYNKKMNWIDFNAGELLEELDCSKMGEKLLNYVIEVASGKKVKSEIQGYRDMAIFKKGVTL